MSIEIKETESYFFVVYGFTPELMRGVAFRREKHYCTKNKKILKCPYCGKDFESVDSAVKVELYRHSRKGVMKYHNSIPCDICHNKIGIIYKVA